MHRTPWRYLNSLEREKTRRMCLRICIEHHGGKELIPFLNSFLNLLISRHELEEQTQSIDTPKSSQEKRERERESEARRISSKAGRELDKDSSLRLLPYWHWMKSMAHLVVGGGEDENERRGWIGNRPRQIGIEVSLGFSWLPSWALGPPFSTKIQFQRPIAHMPWLVSGSRVSSIR